MKKNKIALIYGSDMGATDEVATTIYEKLNIEGVSVLDVYKIDPSWFLEFDILILGVPTWFIGDLQSAWEEFFPEFQKINFEGIRVGFFGLGDQNGYPDNFVDGIGILAEVVKKMEVKYLVIGKIKAITLIYLEVWLQRTCFMVW